MGNSDNTAGQRKGGMPYEGFFEEDGTENHKSGHARDDVLNVFGKIFENYGFDFTRYKPNFIKRRIDRRMNILGIDNHLNYAMVIKKDRNEFEELFTSLSINVTNFFRDSVVYEGFEQTIIPRMLSGADNGRKIRIWSAGCATGEESYSIAMMFANLSEGTNCPSVELLANDISQKAIEFAREGRYQKKSI